MTAASIRSLVKETAIYGISGVIGRSMGLILLPVLSNLLPPEQFGHYKLAYVLIGLLQLMLMFGMGNSLVRYLIDSTDDRRVFSSHFWPLLTVSTIGCTVLYAYAPAVAASYYAQTLPGDTLLIRLAAVVIWLETVNILPYSLLRAKQKPFAYSGALLLSVAVYGAMVIYFLGVKKTGMTGVLAANAISSGVVSLLFIPLFGRYIRPVFDRKLFRIYFAFGFPIIFSSLGKVMLDMADKWILERLIDAKTVAYYSVGYQLGAVANLAVASFTLAWKPYLVRAAKADNAQETFSRIMTVTVAVLAVLFLTISLLADNLVAIKLFGYNLIHSDYWVGLQVIPLVMASYVFFGVYVNLTVGCDLKGKTHYYAWTTLIAAAFNVAANFLLIPIMGMMGAAWATLAAYMLLAGLLYMLTRRIYPVAYRWGQMTAVLGAAGLCYIGCIYLETMIANVWLELLIEISLCAIFVVGIFTAGLLRSPARASAD